MGKTAKAILGILDNAPEPQTTAEIKRQLRGMHAGGEIYGVLFLLQSSGAISCTGTGPWRWSLSARKLAA